MNRIARAAAVIAGASAVAAGSVVAAAPASAAPTPGDLKVTATVACQKVEDKLRTVRLVVSQNVGDTTITGVRVGSLFGPEIKNFPALDKASFTDPVEFGRVLISSPSGIEKPGALAKNESIWVGQVSEGCRGPYAIIGYSIGNEIDNVFNAPNYSIAIGLEPAIVAMANA